MILCPDLADIVGTSKSDAERIVARLLHGLAADEDAVAFHSVMLRSHPRKQDAEADFVVLWRGVVIVVEVKGGGVRKADGRWWSIDRNKKWNSLKESPMDQASGAKYALREILHEDGLGWYADQHMVITPDVDDLEKAIGWPPTHWLSKSDMTLEAMTRALDSVAASAPQPAPRTKRARLVDIRKRLYGEFSRMPSIDAQRGAVIEEQNRATAGQARYLEGLSRNARVLVMGGAGTGKSLALVEGAKQESDQGRSVLITFRSPGLGDYFRAFVESREIAVSPFEEVPADAQYDSVFVDEAQDLMTAEDMDRLDSMVVGGRSGGRWRMFLDRNNQAHVDGGFDEDVFELVLSEAVPFELPLNVRNTKRIVQVVQDYLGADVGDPGIVNGEPLHWHDAGGPADLAFAQAIADELISDGVRPDSIWIIDASSQASPVTTNAGILLTSPRFAKGLEADRVIVCNLPTAFDEHGRAAFYVAATRARVGLHIAVSQADRERLKDMLRVRMAGK